MRANLIDAFVTSVVLAKTRDLLDPENGYSLQHATVLAAYSEWFGPTTLGRGGIGGAAMCEALIVVISNDERQKIAVYRNGDLDYIIDNPDDNIMKLIANHKIPAYKDRYLIGVKQSC